MKPLHTPTRRLALASALQGLAVAHTQGRVDFVFEFVSDTDVKLASRHERMARGLLGDAALTYGEVSVAPLVAALREARAACASLPPSPAGAASVAHRDHAYVVCA